jgi:hypothetical protein
MTDREDVIRIAREAGIETDFIDEGKGQICWYITTDILARFAALVAAAEREACAKRVEVFDRTFNTGGVMAGAIRARGL